jgi:hypothetical protein
VFTVIAIMSDSGMANWQPFKRNVIAKLDKNWFQHKCTFLETTIPNIIQEWPYFWQMAHTMTSISSQLSNLAAPTAILFSQGQLIKHSENLPKLYQEFTNVHSTLRTLYLVLCYVTILSKAEPQYHRWESIK